MTTRRKKAKARNWCTIMSTKWKDNNKEREKAREKREKCSPTWEEIYWSLVVAAAPSSSLHNLWLSTSLGNTSCLHWIKRQHIIRTYTHEMEDRWIRNTNNNKGGMFSDVNLNSFPRWYQFFFLNATQRLPKLRPTCHRIHSRRT